VIKSFIKIDKIKIRIKYNDESVAVDKFLIKKFHSFRSLVFGIIST